MFYVQTIQRVKSTHSLAYYRRPRTTGWWKNEWLNTNCKYFQEQREKIEGI